MLTRPAAASEMPTLAPPCETLKLTLPCSTWWYLAVSSSISGKDAVAPEMESVVAA